MCVIIISCCNAEASKNKYRNMKMRKKSNQKHGYFQLLNTLHNPPQGNLLNSQT